MSRSLSKDKSTAAKELYMDVARRRCTDARAATMAELVHKLRLYTYARL